MKLNDRQAERWSKTRQMGRSRYIRVYGILGWGLSVAIIWSLAMAALQGWDRLPILLPLALIAFPIGGYFWGAFMWWLSERAFAQSQKAGPTL